MEKSKVAVDESSTVDYRNETNSIVSLPPAYHKPPVSTSLKIARILSLTLLAMTAIIGILVIIGMYVHQGYQCQNYATQPMARIDRMDHEQQSSESSKQPVKDLPLKLELDAALGTILKNPKNKKAEVNCVAETKKASQIISQDPKMLMTPFGNFSTDPKLLRLTGERMVLSCISAIDKKPNKKKSANKGILSSFSFFIKSGILVLIKCFFHFMCITLLKKIISMKESIRILFYFITVVLRVDPIFGWTTARVQHRSFVILNPIQKTRKLLDQYFQREQGGF
nr:uncharacterized protein LOC107447791 [Parasteatoda tepidariorum]